MPGSHVHSKLSFVALRCGIVLLALFLLDCGTAHSQTPQTASKTAEPAARGLFFPHDWLRGFVDFSVAPPHNEPDLGRCVGAGPTCTAFARYVLSGYLEVQPFAKTPLRHFYGFFVPTAYLGRNVPQLLYTASAQPIALDRILGLGLELPWHFELRLTNHRVTSFGKYTRSQGPRDPGPGQPLGLYTTVGVRWYFGGYGHADVR
jgi:hypothetical protein